VKQNVSNTTVHDGPNFLTRVVSLWQSLVYSLAYSNWGSNYCFNRHEWGWLKLILLSWQTLMFLHE